MVGLLDVNVLVALLVPAMSITMTPGSGYSHKEFGQAGRPAR